MPQLDLSPPHTQPTNALSKKCSLWLFSVIFSNNLCNVKCNPCILQYEKLCDHLCNARNNFLFSAALKHPKELIHLLPGFVIFIEAQAVILLPLESNENLSTAILIAQCDVLKNIAEKINTYKNKTYLDIRRSGNGRYFIEMCRTGVLK